MPASLCLLLQRLMEEFRAMLAAKEGKKDSDVAGEGEKAKK